MFFMSWHKNSHNYQIVCNSEQAVLFMADILEERGIYFKVSNCLMMISAQEFQGDCKVYKFWLDGK